MDAALTIQTGYASEVEHSEVTTKYDAGTPSFTQERKDTWTEIFSISDQSFQIGIPKEDLKDIEIHESIVDEIRAGEHRLVEGQELQDRLDRLCSL